MHSVGQCLRTGAGRLGGFDPAAPRGARSRIMLLMKESTGSRRVLLLRPRTGMLEIPRHRRASAVVEWRTRWTEAGRERISGFWQATWRRGVRRPALRIRAGTSFWISGGRWSA